VVPDGSPVSERETAMTVDCPHKGQVIVAFTSMDASKRARRDPIER